MNQYFLPKTGWMFFDVSRAYGLGIIVHALSGDAAVSDMGGYYLIESKRVLNFERLESIHRFLGDEQAWNWTLQTLNSAKKRANKKSEVIAFLSNASEIKKLLESFEKIETPPNIREGNETFYQTLDLGATKGIRENVLKSYSKRKDKDEPKAYTEGSNILIKKEDFCLSVVGSVSTALRKKLREKNKDKLLIFVFPTPLNTKIRHIIEISKRINDAVKGLHRAGWFPSLAQMAINLVLEELRVREGGKFTPKFGSLIYGVMSKTGTQWKPLTGGIFPLDFLYLISESNRAREVLNKWRNIFEWTTFKKGYEDLPTALAEFIANPNLSNYERYVRLHLRNELDEKRIKFGSYEKNILKEVIRNVGV